jgi:hypothetical protein
MIILVKILAIIPPFLPPLRSGLKAASRPSRPKQFLAVCCLTESAFSLLRKILHHCPDSGKFRELAVETTV